jgi:sec-independent protein translocase protein TatB
MFDITSSKLLILGIVALIVVGPKDLPKLLRTIGLYMGMIRRQAAEFRAQFDEAMKESELAELKKDVETVGRDVEQTMRDAQATVERDVASANADLDKAIAETNAAAVGVPLPPDPPALAHDALNGLDTSSGVSSTGVTQPLPSPAAVTEEPAVAAASPTPQPQPAAAEPAKAAT